MGNLDRWSTPKQIKIERAGEPRPSRRGALKKGERRKGKKARIDEILSARKECLRYAEYIKNDRQRRTEHPEWYIPVEGRYRRYDPEYRKWFDKVEVKLLKLLKAAVNDEVITDGELGDYLVGEP